MKSKMLSLIWMVASKSPTGERVSLKYTSVELNMSFEVTYPNLPDLPIPVN